MKILVTGAAGFAGGYIAGYLEKQGHDVFRHTRQYGDLATEDFAIGYGHEAIVHCAAAAGPWHTCDDIVRDNIVATQNLIHAAKIEGVRKLIFLSSVSVYGAIGVEMVDEATPSVNPNFYGLSKLMCEKMLSESGLSMVALRCPAIVGPNCGNRHWMARLAAAIKEEQEIELFNSASIYNAVVHIDDVTKFVEKQFADFTPIGGATYLLTAHSPLKIWEAAYCLAEYLGKPFKAREVYDSGRRGHLFQTWYAQRHGFSPMSVDETIKRYAEDIR